MLQALVGHLSEETAYLVEDYPYGQLRCQVRYWVETKPKHGQRVVMRTCNPKTGRWNAPKPTTYSEVVVMYLEPQPDGRHFVRFTGLGFHATDEEINKLRLLVGDEALTPDQWKTVERNRRLRDLMNNRYRGPDEQVQTKPLPSFAELCASTEKVTG